MAAATQEAEDMRVRAEEEAGNILTRAEQDAADLIIRRQKMAEDKIGAAERAAVAQVRAKAAQAATAAAATLIGELHDATADRTPVDGTIKRSAEHKSELQSLMRISYAVFFLKKKTR